MFKIKTIDFVKIRAMINAAEQLVEAGLDSDAKATLLKLAEFLSEEK